MVLEILVAEEKQPGNAKELLVQAEKNFSSAQEKVESMRNVMELLGISRPDADQTFGSTR